MQGRKRATLMDVAREAGVSPQTVSRVVNRKGEVSDETRARIQAVIERLNYRPNRVAQGLAKHHTGVVGLVVPDITSPFYADVVRGVEDCAHQRDYRVFLCNIVESPERERTAIASLEDHGVDGIILAGSRLDDDALIEIIRRNPTIVLINRRLPIPYPLVVRHDDRKAGYLATRHLIEKGHRVICFLGGHHTSFSRRERIVGYRCALEEAGVAVDEGLLFEGYPYLEVGQTLIGQVLTARPDITAVVAFNDLTAVGALQALLTMGKRVPEDIAVVGFDDILIARLTCPPLTTVRLAKRQSGVAAMEMLLGCLEAHGQADGVSREIVLEPELVVRASA